MVNKVILVGRLGKDPEVRHLEGGAAVASFSLATNENYRDKNGEKVEKTDWHNVVVWRKQAEIAEQYLRKGSLIYLEGKLKSRSYDDKDGVKKYITEVVADHFTMLGGKRDEMGNEHSSSVIPESNNAADDDPVDDLPF